MWDFHDGKPWISRLHNISVWWIFHIYLCVEGSGGELQEGVNLVDQWNAIYISLQSTILMVDILSSWYENPNGIIMYCVGYNYNDPRKFLSWYHSSCRDGVALGPCLDFHGLKMGIDMIRVWPGEAFHGTPRNRRNRDEFALDKGEICSPR